MEKYEIIINRLKAGERRIDISENLGYKTLESMNSYMYRKNFKWDAKIKNYYDPIAKELMSQDINYKIQLIISKFADEYIKPLEVALEMGFNDHRDLSSFMKLNGYSWSNKLRNYVLEKEKEKLEKPKEIEQDIREFLPLLRYISGNFNRLEEFLSFNPEMEIPRYLLEGIRTTKTIQISHLLSELISKYSYKKNVSQKEIFEVALIEFLKKYGYKKEIELVLRKEP